MVRPGGPEGQVRWKMTRLANFQVEQGSGNVFADLGFANPEQERLKAYLEGRKKEVGAGLPGMKFWLG